MASRRGYGRQLSFHVLEAGIGSEYETGCDPSYTDAGLGKAPRCPNCGEVVGGRVWLPPRTAVVRRYGKAFGDVAFGLVEFLVSDRFRDAWDKERLKGIVGFAEIEATLRPKPKGDTQRYWECEVERGAAMGKPIAERRKLTGGPVCPYCGNGSIVNAIHGVAIDESTWNGADIFVPWGLIGTTIVTGRVPELASKYSLLNVTTTPAEDYLWDPLNLFTGLA